MDDDEYTALQWSLLLTPTQGNLIQGSGGLRKMRWRGKSKGKRGGFRIIYYYRSKEDEIWLVTLYAKNEESNIPKQTLRKLREELEK